MLYAPDEINPDYIETVCDDLRIELMNLLENDGNNEEYSNACELLDHLRELADELNQRKETK